MATNAELVAQVYVGFYDRAPDPVGLQYWVGRLEAGVSIQDIGDSFAASPEASATYPFFKFPDLLSQDDFLAQVYQNVFGRAIDADGLEYYSGRMTAGESAGSVVASILGNAASNEGSPDQAFLQNKVDAGLHWALTAASTNANIYEADGSLVASASAGAQAALDGITADPATVEAANAATDAFFADGGNGVGEIFTLTNAGNLTTGGVDVVQGTDGADNIRAILPVSLDSSDIIDGGAGSDVLNISAGGINLAANAPVISNVETINNAGGDLDLTAVTGVNTINSSADANYIGASLATLFGASASAVAIDIGTAASLAGTSDTVHLAVDDNAAAVAFTVSDGAGGALSADVEHITLAANGDAATPAAPDVVDLTAFTALESLTVTGAGDVDVGLASTALETFDASAATGDVTVDLSASAVLETATTGSGGDTVTFDAEDAVVSTGAGDDVVNVGGASDGAVVNTGAGVDTINSAGSDIAINGGAGGDHIVLGGGTESLVYSAQADSTYVNFDDVNGFVVGSNTIDLSAFNLTGETGTVADGVTTNTTIGQFAGGVENFFDVGGDTLAVATFTEAGNTYVFADLNNDGNFSAATDLVVQLVGVAAGTVTDADFTFA